MTLLSERVAAGKFVWVPFSQIGQNSGFFMMLAWKGKNEVLAFTQRHLYYMKAETLMAFEEEMRGKA